MSKENETPEERQQWVDGVLKTAESKGFYLQIAHLHDTILPKMFDNPGLAIMALAGVIAMMELSGNLKEGFDFHKATKAMKSIVIMNTIKQLAANPDQFLNALIAKKGGNPSNGTNDPGSTLTH